MTDVESRKQVEKKDDFSIALSNLSSAATDGLETPADFETAIAATGFGFFNYMLLLASVPAGWSSIFDTTSMSYIIPSAECDLELTLIQKGVLTAIVYAGMMTSAFLWGFLADTRGRRSLLLAGYFMDAVCNFVISTSQSFYVLLAFKFLSGFIISGPFAILMTYIAEFHGERHRALTHLWLGLSLAVASVIIPVLAWVIIPQPWSLTLFNGAFVYNSWRIFLSVCALPATVAFFAMMYFPESPKFLMSQGRDDEALEVFQRIYSMNTGNTPETFPVNALRHNAQKRKVQRSTSKLSSVIMEKVRTFWVQVKPLIVKPHAGNFFLIITIQFGSVLGTNTLRLWMPQLFTLIEHFNEQERDPSLEPPTLCEMLDFAPAPMNSTVNLSDVTTCTLVPVADKVYINSIIVAATTVLGYALSGMMVNVIGRKNLLLFTFFIPSICNIALYWAPNTEAILALSSIIVALTNISTLTVISFIVELMPTSLRTMAVSLTMMIGRLGAVSGNILFPVLLGMGCLIPFVVLSAFSTACFLLSMLIPKPSGELL